MAIEFKSGNDFLTDIPSNLKVWLANLGLNAILITLSVPLLAGTKNLYGSFHSKCPLFPP